MKLRDMDNPKVLGHELRRDTLTPRVFRIDMSGEADYGADPLGDGTFKMIPSGDVVDFEERNLRLSK